MPAADLRPAERNARAHPADQVRQLADSISRFGWTAPIVLSRGRIVAGHGRHAAAVALGLDMVPCIVVDEWSADDARAYALADNRIALGAEWDTAALAAELAELERAGEDLISLGFDADEIDRTLRAAAASERSEAVPDAAPSETAADTRLGDLWLLGRHRLLCGSCDDPDAVRRLAPDGWDAAVVDPPYERDDLPGLTDPSIVFGQAKHIRMIPAELWRFERVVDKVQGHRSATVQVLHRHAFVAQVGSVRQLPRDASATYDSIVTVPSTEREHHSHEKPVALLVEHMEAWWPPGCHRVVDLCAGSGSTALACEATGRTALLMEIDPATCDAIVSRWIASGGEARRAEG